MAKRKIEEYTFADAFICSKVKNLMKRSDLLRLAACKDFEACDTLLQEFGYSESKDQLHDIETFIRREQNKLFDMVYDTLPERKELALLLYPFDYHNIKVCLKSEILGHTPDDDQLLSTGDMESRLIVALIRDRNYGFMPSIMKDGVMEALDLYGRSGDPQDIDIVLDRTCYKHMVVAAEGTEDDFLIGIIKFQIDLLNLKSFVRLKSIGKSFTFFKKVFLERGNIPEELFIAGFEDSNSQFAERLAPYGLREVLLEGSRDIKEKNSFSTFEKLCADALMAKNKEGRFLSFGLAPIAAYWYGKEVEIDNIRIVLTGKLLGLSVEEIGERLREPYV